MLVSQETYAARMALCRACEHLEKVAIFEICGKCGCFMPAKARLSDAECPIGKWRSENAGVV